MRTPSASLAAIILIAISQGSLGQGTDTDQISSIETVTDLSLPMSRINVTKAGQSVALIGTPQSDNKSLVSLSAPHEQYDIIHDGHNHFYTGRGDQRLVIRDVTTGEIVSEIEFNGQVLLSLVWAELHQRLYVGLENGEVHYIEPSDYGTSHHFATLDQSVIGLGDAGNNLLVVEASGSYGDHYSFSIYGVILDSEVNNYVSHAYVWNSVLSRTYYTRIMYTPNDLYYQTIDPLTGSIGYEYDSPYHGQYELKLPILVSPTGDRLLVGSGNIFNAENLQFIDTLGFEFATGLWTADGGTILLLEVNSNTRLQRRLPSGILVKEATYTGIPQALIPIKNGYSVVTAQGSEFAVFNYVPSTDGDGDGVPNTEDAFPLDPAASVDSDGDGYPDAWNAGMSQEDSTTGLQLDAYPNEASCYLPEHGDGVNCDFSATIPDYAPDDLFVDSAGVLHLLSSENGKIYRWDSNTNAYASPLIVGGDDDGPLTMEFHAGHNRIYLGYENGDLTYFDHGNPVEEHLLITFSGIVKNLTAAGDDVIAKVRQGSQDLVAMDHSGAILDTRNASCHGEYPAWDDNLKRLYNTFVGCTPSDVRYTEYDPDSNTFGSGAESPYHGQFTILGPIKVSPDGSRVVLGSGDIYSSVGLEWSQTFPFQIDDYIWLDNGESVSLSQLGESTVVQRRSSESVLLEELAFDYTPIGIFGLDGGFIVVTQSEQPAFNFYEVNNDSDGDGVPNVDDAFPTDPAASVDSDNDGYPDAWNPGMGQSDSTTDLELDAYPDDLACYLLSHGDGVFCNYGSTIPYYQPDDVFVDDSGVIHLLSRQNFKIFRWSSASDRHLDPIIVGSGDGLHSKAPLMMEYHAEHGRIYLGYEHGHLTFLGHDNPGAQQLLRAFLGDIENLLTAADDLIVTADVDSGNNSLMAVDQAGAIVDTTSAFGGTRDSVWDETGSRMYYLHAFYSINDVLFREYDSVNNTFGAGDESPYHGDFTVHGPVHVSPDATEVVLGSGDFYRTADLNWIKSVSLTLADYVWLDNGDTVSVGEFEQNTVLQRRTSDFSLSEQVFIDFSPLGIFQTDSGLIVVTQSDQPVFNHYSPSDDSDGDSVPNERDSFPNDRSASQDSDRDGFPDRWNPRTNQDSSTTGLTLDAFPYDAACYLPEHALDGKGSGCDLTSTMMNYVPERTVIDKNGFVYLLSPNENKVYRWNQNYQLHFNPIIVGQLQLDPNSRPLTMAYSQAHDRLYLGYPDGSITFVQLKDPKVEHEFAATPSRVYGLVATGNFLLAQDTTANISKHLVYDENGTVLDFEDDTYYSRVYAWNDALNRVYFFREGDSPFDNLTPNDLHFEEIDPVIGEFLSDGESPYHGEFSIDPPIRLSTDGSRVMLGSGDEYDAQSMTILSSANEPFTDGLYTSLEEKIFLIKETDQTRLERRTQNGQLLERVMYSGEPIAIHDHDGSYTVIVEGDVPMFSVYVPNNDTDGDNVYVLDDDFPNDPAASFDSDGDGYPDFWNEGFTAADSTTGLLLDAFPNDTSCYLPEHGNGISCDYGATIPEYLPEEVLMDNQGMVYLLSRANRRVYRWNMNTGEHEDAIFVSNGGPVESFAPEHMTLSQAQQRLYFGYTSGAITHVDINNTGVELPLAYVPDSVQTLGSAGNFLFAQARIGSDPVDYVLDETGNVVDTRNFTAAGTEPVWNEHKNNLYFLRDSFNPRLYRREIDQQTGEIVGSGSSSGVTYRAPIRFSQDGSIGLSGAGHFFDAMSFQVLGPIPWLFTDGVFTPDGGTIVIRWVDNGTDVERRNQSGELLEVTEFDFSPLAIFESAEDYLLIGHEGQPQFSTYSPGNDKKRRKRH